jgi:hypothetical protein
LRAVACRSTPASSTAGLSCAHRSRASGHARGGRVASSRTTIPPSGVGQVSAPDLQVRSTLASAATAHATVRLGRGSDSAAAWGGVTADIGGGPGADDLDYRRDDGANDNREPCPTDRPCRPRVTLRGGRGADRIWLFMGWYLGPKATHGQFTVIAGPGNDEIYSDGYTRIWAGCGDDVIELLGPGNAVDCARVRTRYGSAKTGP